SSRRRHTRFSRDWSSDVCSSDLEQHQIVVLSNSFAFLRYINNLDIGYKPLVLWNSSTHSGGKNTDFFYVLFPVKRRRKTTTLITSLARDKEEFLFGKK